MGLCEDTFEEIEENFRTQIRQCPGFLGLRLIGHDEFLPGVYVLREDVNIVLSLMKICRKLLFRFHRLSHKCRKSAAWAGNF